MAQNDRVWSRVRAARSTSNKGTYVFAQGEITTLQHDRTIEVPNGNKSIDHVIQQLALELKADTIRLLDRSTSSEQLSADESNDRDEVPR